VPEAALSHAEIASHIANARATLLADLQGWGATEYGSWPTLPFVALKVDLLALQRLASSPLVVSLQEDSLSSPQLASSTALIGADVTVASGFRGDDWAVVILDTGIDTNHPFFMGASSGRPTSPTATALGAARRCVQAGATLSSDRGQLR
jgi:hypothetical protein